MKLANRKMYVILVANSVLGYWNQIVYPVQKDIFRLIPVVYSVTRHVKLVMDKLPQTVRLVQKDIIGVPIVAAKNVINHVKHAMDKLPQIVRLVQQDTTRIIIAAARNVVNYVQYVMEEVPQIVRPVKRGIIGTKMVAARNAIVLVQHAMQVEVLIAYLLSLLKMGMKIRGYLYFLFV